MLSYLNSFLLSYYTQLEKDKNVLLKYFGNNVFFAYELLLHLSFFILFYRMKAKAMASRVFPINSYITTTQQKGCN